jgi:hypothetical protein
VRKLNGVPKLISDCFWRSASGVLTTQHHNHS